MSDAPRPPRVHRGVILVCIAGALWGTAPLAFEFVRNLTALGAIQVSAYRLAIATLVLVIVAASFGNLRSTWIAVRRRPLPVGVLGAGVASYQVLWFAAITQVGTSIATVLSLGLAPVLITAWESWRAHTRPRAAQLVAIAVALTGLILVSLSTPDDAGSRNPAVGLLLASASGILYAATTVLSRRTATTVAPLPLSTASSAVGAVCLLPVALLSGPVTTVKPAALLSLSYLGVVTMALASLLLFSGLRTAHAGATAIATLVEPFTATLLGVILLAEPLPLLAATGIGLILTAVIAVNHRSARISPSADSI
ncbi:DMT family transporter [Microbacterium wangchenii]|uniref:DMT family transporter n=1 Tax=Microbacterium wangchenii TaxID=2541726 RepID=UPI0011C9169A|nr:EamA family transporter [Microbacterium wangchenii]TXK14819.1 EamA family transporter [Microbacterium wangchenii]